MYNKNKTRFSYLLETNNTPRFFSFRINIKEVSRRIFTEKTVSLLRRQYCIIIQCEGSWFECQNDTSQMLSKLLNLS